MDLFDTEYYTMKQGGRHMLIDTHCHINDSKYDQERFLVLTRAKEAGVTHLINIGCDIPTSQHGQALASVHKEIYFSAGIHPHDASKATRENLDAIEQMASDPKCVGIGECGLDFYYNHASKEDQEHALMAQIQIAIRTKKPLILHIREAFDVCFSMLRPYRSQLVGGIVHCFTGTAEDAAHAVELGLLVSISGIVTFKKSDALVKAVASTPLESLLIETDAPYLAPEPYRGKRNEPAWIVEVVRQIAQIKGIDWSEVAKATTHNAKRVFGI